jgi:hypothetical protein
LPNGDRATHRSANHFFATTCPAQVFSRVFNGDRQVVTTSILTGFGTGWTLRNVVPANLSNLSDMIEDSKLATG